MLYYVLPLFRGGPDSSQYIEKFNDSYQAVPVHMHQEDIAKHLAGFVVWGSAESEMDWEKGWENKQQKAVKKDQKKAKKKMKAAKKGNLIMALINTITSHELLHHKLEW